jgi:hypothetical protein
MLTVADAMPQLPHGKNPLSVGVKPYQPSAAARARCGSITLCRIFPVSNPLARILFAALRSTLWPVSGEGSRSPDSPSRPHRRDPYSHSLPSLQGGTSAFEDRCSEAHSPRLRCRTFPSRMPKSRCPRPFPRSALTPPRRWAREAGRLRRVAAQAMRHVNSVADTLPVKRGSRTAMQSAAPEFAALERATVSQFSPFATSISEASTSTMSILSVQVAAFRVMRR